MGYCWKAVILIADTNWQANKVYEAVMEWLMVHDAKPAFTDDRNMIVIDGKRWPNYDIDNSLDKEKSLTHRLGMIGAPGLASIDIMEYGEDYSIDQEDWRQTHMVLTGKGWVIE